MKREKDNNISNMGSEKNKTMILMKRKNINTKPFLNLTSPKKSKLNLRLDGKDNVNLEK